MTLRYSEKIRNAGLDARIEAIGPSPVLRIYGDGNKAIVEITLPVAWMSKAKDGMAHKTGAWSAVAARKGEAKTFEISDADGYAHMTGAFPIDMTLDNPNIEVSQTVVVGTFVIAAGNG